MGFLLLAALRRDWRAAWFAVMYGDAAFRASPQRL